MTTIPKNPIEARTMRASVLNRPGELVLEDRSVPELEADQVLVEVAAVGVCGSDVHYYEHGRIGDHVVNGPLVLGHEASGRIAAVGDLVDPSRLGTRVSIEPQKPCRVCDQCKHGRYNLCPFMEFYATPPIDGAFSQFVAIEGDFAHDVPAGISDEAAALMEPLSVAIWACQRADVRPGHRVLIAGAGPIGILVAQVARAFGAVEIIISDISTDRLAFALEHGATRGLDPTSDTFADLGVDAFIDASGAPAAVRSGIRSVAPGGRVVLVGLGNPDMELPVSTLQTKEIWLTGIFRYANTWPLAIQLVSRGDVDLDVLVTGRFSLAEAEQALVAGKRPGQLKAMVYPGR